MPASSFSDRLISQIREKNSAVCVGLDPRSGQLPVELRPAASAGAAEIAEAYRRFCRGVIDAVAPLVAVVKPQAAFFEVLGPAGMQALAEVIDYAHRAGLLVVLDGKRNDIGSTAEAYAAAYLGSGHASSWGSDALTVSPYLGEDSLLPFVERCDTAAAGIFVLVKTSNPGGGWLQDRDAEGTKVYEHVADMVHQLNQPRLGSCGYGSVGAVVGATYPEQLTELRARIPSAILLIPGFGAQGGAAADVRGGFDGEGLGAIVNSSRHLIFAYERPEFARYAKGPDWQLAVELATREMNEQLNAVRS